MTRWVEVAAGSGAYLNSTFVIGVAESGREDGVDLIADPLVIDPLGQVLARASTLDDELVTAQIDLDEAAVARDRWNFLGRRHPGRTPAWSSRCGRRRRSPGWVRGA
jgi:predicted amidohydrolase